MRYAIVAAAALAFLVWDMLRQPPATAAPRWARTLRALPFVFVALLSIYVAGSAPHGRKPFHVGWSVAPDDLAFAMTKAAHWKSIAVILLLAAIAFGVRRLYVPFAATMLVGVGWEIAEATVVGHYARVADLAPNIASGILTVAVLAAIRQLCRSRRAV